MNILLVSLLRAGDLLMHIKAVEDLSKLSNAKLYLLTHRQNVGLDFLFPWIKKVFYFDRDLVQKSQKETFLPLDSGFQHTMKLISEINQIKFETIYNFTNTKISALLTSLLNAKSKIGLNNTEGQYSINDPNHWIQYLNNTEDSKFHMIDIFRKSITESLNTKTFAENKTSTVREKTICIQVLTSDLKKNWPLKNWNALLKQLAETFSDYKIHLLCANVEKTKLVDAFEDNIGNIFVSTYKEAFDVVSTAALLITGDTSIKHLASFTTTPVLELALGSAKPNETGVYSKDGYLLYKPLSCQPCKHSSQCNNSYICHNSIAVDDVFKAITYILNVETLAPKTLFKAVFNKNSLLSYEPASGIRSGESNERKFYAAGV